MIVGRLAHLALRVADPEEAANFYIQTFGMTTVGAPDDGVRLATGTTNTFELCLREGAPELDHVALTTRGPEALDAAGERLAGAGAEVTEVDVTREPGLARAIETVLPSDHVVRLVLESDPSAYSVTSSVAPAHHRGIGPVALEHVTLLCSDIGETATFLDDALDLRISDSVQPPGGPWGNTHLRAGVLHHDIGLLPGTEAAMHHFAFAVPSISQLAAAADAIAARGMSLDASIGRHVAGNNVFVYFRDTEGHRVEVNTDMARVDPGAAPQIVAEPTAFDAWRPGRPPAMASSTPARCRSASVNR